MNAVKEWLNMFKTLAFIRPDLVSTAWTHIIKLQPSYNSKYIDFFNYFKETWYGNDDVRFSISLWNHYYTEGPRTNNHVEGYNHKINNYINHVHPHIYSAINTLKTLETSTGLNFYQRESGSLTQFRRRPVDIQRDVMVNYLKNKLNNGNLSIMQFFNRMGNLFRYVVFVVLETSSTRTYFLILRPPSLE